MLVDMQAVARCIVVSSVRPPITRWGGRIKGVASTVQDIGRRST